ncbi:MAG: cobalt-precorrin-5B (C(1))-methyltransferase [Prevotellaceae bacterium]|nr:cobalt-precorrin-5B (C(1))-methyltransferase [Candidatus Minthosoma equi]
MRDPLLTNHPDSLPRPSLERVQGETHSPILIFGGTTEGRIAIDVCEQAGKRFFYSTKGSSQVVEMHHGIRISGGMSSEEIKHFCSENEVRCIVDAAHPFAENLHKAIAEAGLPVIRLQRHFPDRKKGVVYCSDWTDAVSKMSSDSIHCLLALSGVNTIAKLSGYWQHHKTIFRILNRAESIDTVQKNLFPTSNIILYNDDNTLPSLEAEKQLMQQVGCDAILTKESGDSGGFMEKVGAALELGLKVYVVEHPQLPSDWIYADGRHTLRRAIEHAVPDFFPLRTGLTTGACATAAAKAALLSLLYGEEPEETQFALPDGEHLSIPVKVVEPGKAEVIKEFSDDPDVTRGCRITAAITENPLDHSRFLQGKGVGTVTLPGLGIPVGEPAINPTPRKMILDEIQTLSDKHFDIIIEVENGEEIALKTFNPKVGVMGGISIIGTSGIVSPLSNEAFILSIRREMEVAHAIGCTEIALVSGKKAEDYVLNENENYNENESIRFIHYGNFIGDALKCASDIAFEKVTLAIMIGKAVKLAEGHLNTHSHKVTMNKAFLKDLCMNLPLGNSTQLCQQIDSITLARELWSFMPPSFFEAIRQCCLTHCKTVFPDGKLEIILICDEQQ